MGKDFDKKLMLDNISFLLKETGKKIGEVESEAGVSTGYLSRINKDVSTKPGVDFIIRVADALNTSVDTLLHVDLNRLTSTEQYLLSFLSKLKADTLAERLDWNRETSSSLNAPERGHFGELEHPLFEDATYYTDCGGEYPEQVTEPVFKSNSFDVHTYFDSDCYNVSLSPNSTLYLMDVVKNSCDIRDAEVRAKELWMYIPRKGKQFLCCNAPDNPLTDAINDLYDTVANSFRHPKIIRDVRTIIDDFMNGAEDVNNDNWYF